MPDMKVIVVYTVLLVEFLLKLYLLEYSWKTFSDYKFPETISIYYYILIMCEFTQTLKCVIYSIICIAIVSLNREVGQIEGGN